MTRINLVPPAELTDQHLFAEFREIKMVPKSLARSIAARGAAGVLQRIPPAFTLNTGHVTFFYDKGAYLRERYTALKAELDNRSINYNRESELDPDGTMLDPMWSQPYTPTPQALEIIRARIAERIAFRPGWYRFQGKPLEQTNDH